LHNKTHHERPKVPAIQIAVLKGKFVNTKFYKGKVLHKSKKYFNNRRPATGLHGVRLLHDNALSHKAAIVRKYPKRSFLVLLLRQILPLVTFFLFPRFKNTLLEENIKSRFDYCPVSEQYTSKRL
jgi:histone-lysine N-methyltransferase SETMAR